MSYRTPDGELLFGQLTENLKGTGRHRVLFWTFGDGQEANQRLVDYGINEKIGFWNNWHRKKRDELKIMANQAKPFPVIGRDTLLAIEGNIDFGNRRISGSLEKYLTGLGMESKNRQSRFVDDFQNWRVQAAGQGRFYKDPRLFAQENEPCILIESDRAKVIGDYIYRLEGSHAEEIKRRIPMVLIPESGLWKSKNPILYEMESNPRDIIHRLTELLLEWQGEETFKDYGADLTYPESRFRIMQKRNNIGEWFRD